MKSEIVLNRLIAIYLVTLRPTHNKDNFMQNYEEIMKVADKYVAPIDLNRFPFGYETEESRLIKYYRPALTGRLLFN